MGCWFIPGRGANGRDSRSVDLAEEHELMTRWFVALVVVAATVGPQRSAEVEVRWLPGGPDGGPVNDLAFAPSDPDRVYVATAAGVFSSTDGGATWQQTAAQGYAEATRVAVDPVDPDRVYALMGDLVTSDDSGRTWRSASDGVPLACAAGLAVSRERPGTVVLGLQ
jgi:hypothetical protein